MVSFIHKLTILYVVWICNWANTFVLRTQGSVVWDTKVVHIFSVAGMRVRYVSTCDVTLCIDHGINECKTIGWSVS